MYSTFPNLHPQYAQKSYHSPFPSSQPSRPPSPAPLPFYQSTSTDIAAESANLNIQDTNRVAEQLPQPEPYDAHLKLLQAFHELKDDVSSSGGLFDLNDRDIPSNMPPESRDAALRKLAQKRWAIYVARAVDRFAKWWYMALPSRPQGFIRMNEFDVNGPVLACFDDPAYAPIVFTPDNLPPLDVLMIWHTFMLNPQCLF